MHLDIKGPLPESVDHKIYVVEFVDAYSNYAVTYNMKSKGEAVLYLRTLIATVQERTKYRISILRCDQPPEFYSAEMDRILADNYIVLEFSAVYTKQQNGVAERYWRTVYNSARCLLHEAALPPTGHLHSTMPCIVATATTTCV